MPTFRTLADIALGYGAKAEDRSGPRYREPSVTLSYGEYSLQALDLHLCEGDGAKPLIVFVHGGAWQFGDKTRRLKDAKVPFCHSQSWHFAAVNFRMVPEVTAREMARDVAAGLALLLVQAEEHGIDRQRVVLMGHSSGAHLATLVASDPFFLGEHGLGSSDLCGVIANDGAAYDPSLPSTGSRLLARRLIAPAFAGEDLKALSPVAQIGQHGLFPPCLILHAGRRYAHLQAQALEQALLAEERPVLRHAFPGTSVRAHMHLSRKFGLEGFGPTEVARDWLRALLAD